MTWNPFRRKANAYELSAAFDEGLEKGFTLGRNQGLYEGHEDGYTEGFTDGLYKGQLVVMAGVQEALNEYRHLLDNDESLA